MHRNVLTFLSLPLLASASAAQSPLLEPTTVVRTGVSGGFGTTGLVESLRQFVLIDGTNGGTSWAAHIDTDTVDETVDEFIVQGIGPVGTAIVQENQGLPDPTGTFADAFVNMDQGDDGTYGFLLALSGAVTSADNRGIFRGLNLILQEGDVGTAPELTPGSRYTFLRRALFRDDETFLFLADSDDPALLFRDQVLVQAVVVPTDTNNDGIPDTFPHTEAVLHSSGETLQPGNEQIREFADRFGATAMSADGKVTFVARVGGLNWAIVNDGQIVAQDSQPAPGATGNYAGIFNAFVDRNDHGDFAFVADTVGGQILVVNGLPFAETGTTTVTINGITRTLNSLGGGQSWVKITNSGDVVWTGAFGLPGDETTCIFVNERLVVFGSDAVSNPSQDTDGNSLSAVGTDRDLIDVSEDGRFLGFNGEFSTMDEGLLMLDIGGRAPFFGCTGNVGTLQHLTGEDPTAGTGILRVGETITFETSGAPFGTIATVIAGTAEPNVNFPCGQVFNLGGDDIEFLFDLTAPLAFSGTFVGTTPKTVTLPADPSFIGLDFFVQALFVASGSGGLFFTGGTNGLTLIMGGEI